MAAGEVLEQEGNPAERTFGKRRPRFLARALVVLVDHGVENAEDIAGLESRVQLAFEALLGRPTQ
jgi:hypothetical protein